MRAVAAREQVIVVAGVIVDAARMHATSRDWDALIDDLADVSDGKVVEIKTRKLYRGGGYRRTWDGGEPTALVDDILTWMDRRKHKVTFGVIEKGKRRQIDENETPMPLRGASDWCAVALHLLLSIQKEHQKEKNNKGKTVVVFDDARERRELIELLRDSTGNFDNFSTRKRRHRAFDQLVDVPYFAGSRDVGLLQVAGHFAYFIRLYAELEQGLTVEKFAGERARIAAWMEKIGDVLLSDAGRRPVGSKDPIV